MAQALENPRVRRLQPSSGGRVPPHDLDAEESLLGAMLLSRDAIAAALECTTSEDFYKPAHSHIFAAITSLYTKGEPADPVTVADELRRAGLLEDVGDPSMLISLQVNTPSTANAGHYARIVEEHALLRRMVSVAAEIAELGFSVPEDVSEVIDRAESMMFEVAQRRVVNTMTPLRELLAASLDHLEQLYARGDTITGVPTGYSDLDERLAGLQKSNLVVVGARPAMGKALDLDTPIPTPSGWTTMGALAVGDEVFDEQGSPCRVEYVSPVFVGHRCYEVRFDDGSALVADAGHRWLAYDYPAWKSHREQTARLLAGPPEHPLLGRDQTHLRRMPRVVTTEEMLAQGVRAGDDRPNWYIALAAALGGAERRLPVDPYALGCWVVGGEPEEPVDPAVLGLGPDERRRVPDAYLRAAPKQRLAVLQGVMDQAGTVANANGTVELCLADRAVVEQVYELVASLGHKPHAVRRRVTRLAGGRQGEVWRFCWTPLEPVFLAPAKADRLAATASRRANGKHTRRSISAITEVPSRPVRCISVSSPSHLFLAGRAMVPTHNTSFALGIVANAAVKFQVPVLLFSLEMSHLELTQRLLCSEAKVDSNRLRTGRLLEADWPKISDAIGRLGDAPIYIDDNPNVTVMDIRAKARRLKAREGLGLVVVDYLQLMSGHSKSRAENRQVEVSEISRGLKVLARELDIPVVALSQLSRNLEMRQDKRPVLADLRESGCLTADTLVTRADTGAEVTMSELLYSGARNVPVWALDDDQLRLVPATMTHVFQSGVKRIFELRLASGRRVRASANHPFRTVLGWRRLDELACGDRLVAVGPDFDGRPSFRAWSPMPSPPATSVPSGRSVALLERPSTVVPACAAIVWDEVVAIVDKGEAPVFDATVLEHHNFLANGIVAHNSIEQDSDVVMFIYRDEVYNPDSPDRGSAEIIIAKHRNGPVGTTQLAFLDRYTRFADQARV
jgi:replicative DNA helicase